MNNFCLSACSFFFRNFAVDLEKKLSMLPQPVGLFRLVLNFFCTSTYFAQVLFKGKNSACMI